MESQGNNQFIYAISPYGGFEKRPNILWTNLPIELLIKIFNYLPHSDLQQIRLVCKCWHELIHARTLMKKTKLVINARNIDSVLECLNDDRELFIRLSYDTLELHDLEARDKLKLILKAMGTNIHTLYLKKSPVFEMLNEYVPELEDLMISHIPTVRTKEKNLVDFNKFKNFKSLDMGSGFLAICIQTDMLVNVAKRFSMTLEKLSLELNADQERFLLQIIKLQCCTLKHLEIVLRFHPTDVIVWKPAFSLLRSLETLKITGSSSYQWLYQIIASLPKETPLKNCDLSGGLQVDDKLLNLIINKFPESLQSIELMFCNALSDETVKNLSTIRHSLRHLNLSYCTNVSTEALIDGLASHKNPVLKTLVLDYMSTIKPETTKLLSSRLLELTYLSLDNCRDSVDDTTLGCVFRHLVKLQHLVLDDCVLITDKGIVGFGLNPSPISRLKGLQSLSLRGCNSLSNRSLMNGFKFLELRKLVLSYCRKISTNGIECLVRNCRALEDLTITSCLMMDDSAVLQIAIGLSRLRRLNISNCINLTSESFKYVTKYCKSVKELSMCGIDLWDLQQIEQKILQDKFHIFKLDSFTNLKFKTC